VHSSPGLSSLRGLICHKDLHNLSGLLETNGMLDPYQVFYPNRLLDTNEPLHSNGLLDRK